MWPALAALAAVVLVPVGVRLVRRDRRRARRLAELTEQLGHERERAARLTVTEERARIAHELHDVVAHQLSVIAIQAAALDQEEAPPPVRAIRRAADEALDAMRRALEVLRDDEEAPERAPQPGLAELPALVARARAAGMPVTLHVEGARREVPAGLDLSAFRIVQEALANVHKHAGGAPAMVRVAWRRDTLALYVRDTGARAPEANGDGHGLVGMRERVRALGGELHAGPRAGGGYEVVARLPL